MDLIVMYAIENVCQQKVSYDTPISWCRVETYDKTKEDLFVDSLDFEWIFNEIEHMSTVVFDDDVRCWIVNNIIENNNKNKKVTVSDLIRDVETQVLLLRSKKIAQRNPAGKPKSLKNKKNICLAELRPEGVSCALTEQKCDKVPQYKNTDIENICTKSNCKIAQNFYKLAQKTK